MQSFLSSFYGHGVGSLGLALKNNIEKRNETCYLYHSCSELPEGINIWYIYEPAVGYSCLVEKHGIRRIYNFELHRLPFAIQGDLEKIEKKDPNIEKYRVISSKLCSDTPLTQYSDVNISSAIVLSVEEENNNQEDVRTIIVKSDYSVQKYPYYDVEYLKNGMLTYSLDVGKEDKFKIRGTFNLDSGVDSDAIIDRVGDTSYKGEDNLIVLPINSNDGRIDLDSLNQTLLNFVQDFNKRASKNIDRLRKLNFEISDRMFSKPIEDGEVMLDYVGCLSDTGLIENFSLSNSFEVDFSNGEKHKYSELLGNGIEEDTIKEKALTEGNPRNLYIRLEKGALTIEIFGQVDSEDNLLGSCRIDVSNDKFLAVSGVSIKPNVIDEQYRLDLSVLKDLLNINLINPPVVEEKRREKRRKTVFQERITDN